MSTPIANMGARLARLRTRRQGPPTSLMEALVAKEAFERIQEDDAVKYIIGSMQPIDPEYTKNTIAEANRVKSQLEDNYPSKGVRASFDYQGSVTNDTHIFRYSDIDLLALTDEFSYKENVMRITSPYQGNATATLFTQHNASVDIIKTKFPEVTVDTSGGKAIQLSGGSLRRKIDVITTTWWDTIAYDASGQKKDRGIKVFNYKSFEQIENKPFLHNHNIGMKDAVCTGNLRKAIRFLKTVKADANEEAGYCKVDVSSYDICAICHAMGYERLLVGADEELRLARNAQQFLDYLEQNDSYRTALDVPNGMRKIFGSGGASLEGLKQLNHEVKALLDDVSRGLTRSFRTLEARIPH